jgi:beta-glucosidase
MSVLMKKLFQVIFSVIIIAGVVFAQTRNSKPIYKDPKQPINKRVEDLLSRMTLQEKVNQMMCLPLENPMEDLVKGKGTKLFTTEDLKNGIGEYSLPSFSASINRKPCENAELCNAIQKLFIEKSRLGIPVIMHEEALHGFNAIQATDYPIPIAMACSFDPALVHKVFTEIANEASSRGTNEVLTPVLDLGREPRWGRTEETYGEDPYLVSRMGVAAITGLQGNTLPLIDRHHVAATMKHFAAHGSPEGGRNIAPPDVDERTLLDIMLKPFKAAVQDAGVKCVMASYNEIDGVPSHANKWLLTDLLRNQWGFKGIVVSDWYGIPGLINPQHIAKDEADAALLAVNAGVDVDLPTIQSYKNLTKLVEENKLDESLIDKSVRRILRLKFQLGLFDHPYVDPDYAVKIAGCESHRKTSQKMAEESMVLLKNENNLLPLDLKRYKTIAVIGPSADYTEIGNYANEPKQRITILKGLKDYVGNKAQILFSQGVKLTEENPYTSSDTVRLVSEEINKKLIKNAVKVAKQSDIVILCLGENHLMQREAWADYHRGDNASLELRADQNELVKEIHNTGKPIVVLLFSGGPLCFNYINKIVPSIIECFYLGQETGYAVANVLLGKANPGGKLSISIPVHSDELPDFYDHKPSKFREYLFDPSHPLYHFGYGLSYTTFKISDVRLENQTINKSDSVKVFADVTNTGNVKGDEVLQMYIHQEVSSVTRPVEELKDFKRISLEPGETKTVQLLITPDKLSYYNINMHYDVEPGIFDVMVGNSSRKQDLTTVKLTIK